MQCARLQVCRTCALRRCYNSDGINIIQLHLFFIATCFPFIVYFKQVCRDDVRNIQYECERRDLHIKLIFTPGKASGFETDVCAFFI